MQIIVTDRDSIEAGFIIRAAYVVVSIHDPDKKPARVRKQSGLRGELHVAFHDAEPTDSTTLPTNIRLMSDQDAAAIWAFVNAHRQNVGAVVIHCEQGMSRSPAVAAAISRAWALDDAWIWSQFSPNLHVFRLMELHSPTGQSDAGREE